MVIARFIVACVICIVMSYHCVEIDNTYLAFVPGHAANLINQQFSIGVLPGSSCKT